VTVTAFLLALGATARIVRFVNADYLFRGVRAGAIKRWGPDHDIPYLLTCGWCASIWIAGAVYTVAWFYGHTPAYLIATGALSASWIYAVVAGWLDPTEGMWARALTGEFDDEEPE
jgi:hypothetical protein